MDGVCNENVTVRDELTRITIDGQGSATIHGPSPAAAVIQVLGRNITIKRFTITGGRQGFSVLRGGSVLIDSNTIEDSAGAGIWCTRTLSARIVNNAIQFNPNTGHGSGKLNCAHRVPDLADPWRGTLSEEWHRRCDRFSEVSLLANAISENATGLSFGQRRVAWRSCG